VATRIRIQRQLTRSPAVAVLIALLAACGDEANPSPEPTPVRSAPAPAAEEVAAILERCHGPLEGRFQRSVMLLHENGDGAPTTVWFDWPARFRWSRPDRTQTVWRDDGIWRWGPEDEAARELTGAEAAAVRRDARMLGAIALQPLSLSRGVHHAQDDAIELEAPGPLGATDTWSVQVDRAAPDADAPEIVAMTAQGDDGLEIHFDRWQQLPRTRLPARVSVGDAVWGIRFLENDAAFQAAAFALPQEDAATAQAIRQTQPVPLDTAPVARVESFSACRWLVLDDPGEDAWDERFERLRAAAQRLGGAGQRGAGDAMLARAADGHAVLVLPFQAVDASAPAYEPQDGESVVEVPAHRAVVAEATEGESYRARVAAARSDLQSWFEERDEVPPAMAAFRVAIDLFGDHPGDDPAVGRDMPIRVEWRLDG
jgi:hypothetical protein